jgi:hypothetical protein
VTVTGAAGAEPGETGGAAMRGALDGIAGCCDVAAGGGVLPTARRSPRADEDQGGPGRFAG